MYVLLALFRTNTEFAKTAVLRRASCDALTRCGGAVDEGGVRTSLATMTGSVPMQAARQLTVTRHSAQVFPARGIAHVCGSERLERRVLERVSVVHDDKGKEYVDTN